MFLKLLEKLGRKKVVLDRGPSHPNYDQAKPWMNRYYLLFRHRPRWFPFNILIHEMLDDDHGDGVHNHLFPYMTIVIRGVIGKLQLKVSFGEDQVTLVFDQPMHFTELILNQEQDR